MPQSHLGRLVQSITSPLVLSSGGYRDSDSDGYSDPSSGYYSQAGQEGGQAGEAPEQPVGRQQAGALQQAPSQQRGIPQHYYGQMGNQNGNDDDRDQGSAPSTNKGTSEYQMGAYLGPTMDDKEINGVFNSNDDRDDDDGPASYDGSSMGRNKAASNAYGSEGGGAGEGYGPSPAEGAGGEYERRPGSGAGPDYQGAGYDEDGADEDEGPAPRGRRGGQRGHGSGLSRAASQYRQRGYGGAASAGQAGHSQMMAAANGYAPYGYSGPADLSGLMSAGIGADPSAGYQAYNGDGSYPGAGYYQQQGQPAAAPGRGRGGRGQPAAESASGAHYNQGYDGPTRPKSASDSDENDNEPDED